MKKEVQQQYNPDYAGTPFEHVEMRPERLIPDLLQSVLKRDWRKSESEQTKYSKCIKRRKLAFGGHFPIGSYGLDSDGI